jgi:hypothetical protein
MKKLIVGVFKTTGIPPMTLLFTEGWNLGELSDFTSLFTEYWTLEGPPIYTSLFTEIYSW